MKAKTNPTIKAHLIRGVLLLIAVCAVPFALAQFPQVILYDQYDPPGNASISSENRPDMPEWSDEAADNFVIPATQIWQITEVDIHGSGFFNTPSSFDVHFYTDAEGLPGTEVYVATGLAFVVNLGNYIITVTSPAILSEGTYWVSVVGNITDFAFFWDGRNTTNNGFATAYRNPLDGLGTCCTDWARAQDCLGVPYYDQRFRLVGNIVSVRPAPTARPRPTPRPRP